MKSNPFATRFVQPGRLTWISARGESLQALADRFSKECGSRASIVGPHGTGKSTLLENLLPLLGGVCWRQPFPALPIASRATSGTIVWLGLRRRQSPLRQILDSCKYWKPGGILVLDGMEQLRPWERGYVLMRTRQRRMGLLATSHQVSAFLPVLYRTSSQTEIVCSLVSRLLELRCDLNVDTKRLLTDAGCVERLIAEEQGNVREVFMRLYDRYELLAEKHANSATFQIG